MKVFGIAVIVFLMVQIILADFNYQRPQNNKASKKVFLNKFELVFNFVIYFQAQNRPCQPLH